MLGKPGSEIRVECYERAIRWFEGVAKGTITPNLPKLMGDETETAAAFMPSADTNDHNKWWQPLNNHWTTIEQTLSKPCSNPSNNLRASMWFLRLRNNVERCENTVQMQNDRRRITWSLYNKKKNAVTTEACTLSSRHVIVPSFFAAKVRTNSKPPNKIKKK